MKRRNEPPHLHAVGNPPAVMASGDSGDGSGTEVRLANIESRLSSLETRMDYLATKEDISDIKTLIADRESRLLRYAIGVLLPTLGTLIVAGIRVFY